MANRYNKLSSKDVRKRMQTKMIKPFSVTFANIEFTLNKTSSIMLIINFLKVSAILGIVFYVAGKFYHPQPVKSDKNFFVCIHNLSNDSNLKMQ